MKEFFLISNYMLKGSHTEENPSKNERNPEMMDVSLISNEILNGIRIEEHPSKNGIKDFSLISNEILRRVHIQENPSRNEKSRDEGILFDFY